MRWRVRVRVLAVAEWMVRGGTTWVSAMVWADWQEVMLVAGQRPVAGALGPTVDVPTAARLLGCGRTLAYELVRRGSSPAGWCGWGIGW